MAIIGDILRKLHLVKPLPAKQPVEVNVDAKAIADFLLDSSHDRERLLKLIKKFLELRLEYRTLLTDEMKNKNIEHQINLFDEIISAYSFFQEDADVNGNRIKQIAKVLREAALKSNNEALINKTNDLKWRFDW